MQGSVYKGHEVCPFRASLIYVAAMGAAVRYSVQCLQEVAVRRGKEARNLLEVSKRQCDGAVTCALLAAECALKATILFGHRVQYHDEVPLGTFNIIFKGSSGHSLALLLQEQPPTVRRKAPIPVDEIQRLNRRDRYQHRYGHLRPRAVEAMPLIADAEKVVAWMEGVLS